MALHRSFIEAEFGKGTRLFLPSEEAHHLRVMRLHEGEEVELLNGKGSRAKARLLSLSAPSVEIESCCAYPPRRHPIILAQAILRPAKLDWVVEKATELGADSIALFCADKGVCNELSSNRLERLQQIAIAALKQSGNPFLPPIHFFKNLKDLLKAFPNAEKIFGELSERSIRMKDLREPRGATLCAIGPESGWSPAEQALFEKAGAIPLLLHPYTLRAESAAVISLALLAQRSSDF